MIPPNESEHAAVARKLRDTEMIKAALKKAAREAILQHARAGIPIVIWRDNQIVIEHVRVS